MGHYILIGIIVAALVGLQLYIFLKNLQQMKAFRGTFGQPGRSVTYTAKKNASGQVVGIRSSFSNPYFFRIESSIGEYLEANAGGNIDFQLIKDAVDRNCDSVEEDANAQIPLPLYIGLAGTMLGIIIGIGYLWVSGQLHSLLELGQTSADAASSALGASTTQTSEASKGIETLLSGVALAMIASISGLAFTTIATWIFKGIKLEVEIGKNRFFTWMQSNLLPEVANDTVDAFRKLGKTLGRFNTDFSRNSEAFGKTMDRILGVNSTQNQLLSNVETMNTQIEQMSQRNYEVATKLSGVMSVLDHFAHYVQSINGYTSALQGFTEQFNDEVDRLHVMEAMKDFFEQQGERLKREEDSLKKGMAKLDNALIEGTGQLKNRVTSSNDELKKLMTQQKDQFQTLLNEQTKMFKDAHDELIKSIRAEMGVLPQTASTLNAMPDKIKSLLDGYKRENDKLVSQLSSALSMMNRTLKEIGVSGIVTTGEGGTVIRSGGVFPKWMNWVIVALIAIMAIACVANTFMGYKSYKQSELVMPDNEETVAEEIDQSQSPASEAIQTESTIQSQSSNVQAPNNGQPVDNTSSSDKPKNP